MLCASQEVIPNFDEMAREGGLTSSSFQTPGIPNDSSKSAPHRSFTCRGPAVVAELSFRFRML